MNSNRKSYSVGHRHWVRFQRRRPAIAFFPFASIPTDPEPLSLCFFVAYLTSCPTIRRYTSVRSYICHVKALWRDAGCSKTLLESPLLTAVLCGVRRALPAPPDPRSPFILSLYQYHPPSFSTYPPSHNWRIFKAVVTLGFHAMIRFGAFCQLTLLLDHHTFQWEEWPLSCVPLSLLESR